MAEELDVAGLLRPGDRLAWSAGPMEPTDLIGVLGRQLDRVPRISVLLNLSLQTTIDAARLASRATVTALGGAVTNRRFQEIGALDVLPINYSTLPDLVASGRLAIDVVLLQVAAEGDAYNLSLMVDHLADAVPRARAVVAEINDVSRSPAARHASKPQMSTIRSVSRGRRLSFPHDHRVRSSARSRLMSAGWSGTARRFRSGLARCPMPCSRA